MILFVLRRHNDIDHMVPVIYRMAKDGSVPVLALAMDPATDIREDHRLRFLREKCGVRIESIYKFHRPSVLLRKASRLFCTNRVVSERSVHKDSSDNSAKSTIPLLISAQNTLLGTRFYEKLVKPYLFNDKWAASLLAEHRVGAVVFDYAKVHQYVTGAIVQAAAMAGIPTVSIPHGLKMWAQESHNLDTYFTPEFSKLLPFDSFILSNEWSKNFYHQNGTGMPAERMHVVGSARYCSEWMEACKEVYPRYRPDGTDSSDKLKVVFFEGGDRFVKNQSVVLEALSGITSLNFLDIVVQPRPRASALPINHLDGFVRIDKVTPAFSLCMWADVVITGITSVYMEALCQGKTLLFPKYWHTRPTVLEEKKVCWIVESHKELEDALKRLKDDPKMKPYTDTEVEDYIVEMVYGGVKGRDVLGQYSNLILEKAQDAGLRQGV